MLYAIISQDVEDSFTKRIGARPDHIARLNQLKDELTNLETFQQLASQYFHQERPVSDPINAAQLSQIVDFSLGAEGAELAEE